MNKEELKIIQDALNEARYFSKDVRKYLFEIEKQRPLTDEEQKLWKSTHDVHIHTNDSGMIIQEHQPNITCIKTQ